MFTVIQAVSQGLPDNVVCTNGAGNFATWLHRFHKLPGFDGGHRHQLAPTNGSMGYGVPAGVAAALASGRPVFTIAGDGDFLMNGQELATATAEGVKTVVLLLNNGMYGTIRMHQEREFPGRVSGSGLRNPDFCLLAQGFGYHAERVTQTAAFAGAWERAWAHPGGALIELMLDPEVITPKLTLQEIREAAQR
jgi:acetolactate synthase-1/2/3 large subunit